MTAADALRRGYFVFPDVSDDVMYAVLFLEARGQRFLVDFRFNDALQKAHAIWRREQVM
jgi:hypothetical protein